MQQNRFSLALGLIGGAAVAGAALFFVQNSADADQTAPAMPPAAAVSQASAQPAAMPAFDGRRGVVAEVIEAPGYTYVRLETPEGSYWAAGPTFAAVVGEELLVPAGMAMDGYESVSLERSFEQLDFVGGFVRPGDMQAQSSAPGAMPPNHPEVGGGSQATVASEAVVIEPLDGGMTVAEVFASRLEKTGQEIELRGRVVKVNRQIMGSNWLHIQDGTGGPGTDDLVVTSQGIAAVGDNVVIRGTLTADKDFGAGYSYEAIVEDAQISVE